VKVSVNRGLERLIGVHAPCSENANGRETGAPGSRLDSVHRVSMFIVEMGRKEWSVVQKDSDAYPVRYLDRL